MAERLSSAANLEEHSKAFQVGKDSGRGSKTKNNKKRRRGKKQKKEQCPEQSLESAESADSLVVMSTAEHCESKSNSAELPEQEEGGGNERPPAQVSGGKMAAERNEQGAGALEASAPNSTVAKGETGIPCKETIAGKRKELLENTGPDTHDDGTEMIKNEEDKSDEQQQTSVKKKRDLLSFRRPKKNKTQRAKNARQKQNSEERNDTQVCAAKSKDDGNEGREDKEIGEPSAKNEIDNSPESGETAENNKEQIGDYEKTREVDAASSNKAKKFKPLASFRRHKKKADASTNASLEEQTAENAETKEAPKDAGEDVEKGESLSNEDGEKTELNEDTKRKTKKFSPLRSFRKSKPARKSTTDGAKQKSEEEQTREDAGEELGQKPDVHQQEQVAQQSGAASLSEEYPGAENVELIPAQENIQNERGADVDGEEMTPTKKAKKKGLLRRQMKKIWSTSGKAKEAASVEKEASVVNEGTKPDSCEQQESCEDVPSPPVAADSGGKEASADEILATEQECCEEKSSVETVEKTKEEEEVMPENAGREEESAHMDPVEKTGKTLVAQQMKEVKTNKKRDETSREDEDNEVGESAGVDVADPSETSKQVKRKKSGFRKISNALKKKKTGEEGWEINDQGESEGLMEKEPEGTDHKQTVTEEVCPAEDGEQRPLEPDQAYADGKEENTETKNGHEVQKADDAEQSSELVDETEEQPENSAGSTQAYRTHGDLMKPVIQELLAKIAKTKLVPASWLAAPEVDADEESEFTKTSDDYSLTSVTNTATDDSNPSIVDVCSDSKDATESEQTAEESNCIEVDHDENPNDETTDVVAIEQPRVPSDPEGQKKPQLEESSKVAIPTSAAPAPVPGNVPNAPDAEPSGNLASSEAVESDEDKEDQGEGDKDEDESNQTGQETQMANSEDLVNSAAGLTSDLDSSQAAPSKGRREDWILVNHLEISQELSHQLKVFALDSFEHGTPGCCNIM